MERCMEGISRLCATYPYRGLKGAVGTRLDQVTLLGSSKKANNLIKKLWKTRCDRFLGKCGSGISGVLILKWFHYFRVGISSGKFAKTLRIMAGHELLGEGFAKGQTGSSAMPHKMNSRSCERINGFHAILSGYVTMATQLSGDQWNEGDVSCSVVQD